MCSLSLALSKITKKQQGKFNIKLHNLPKAWTSVSCLFLFATWLGSSTKLHCACWVNWWLNGNLLIVSRMQNDILPYFTHTADIYEEEATVKWLVETIKIVDIRFKISMQYTSIKKRFLLSHKSLYNILFLYSIILYLSLHFHLTSKRSLVQSWEETNPFLVAAGRASGLKPANSYIQANPLWQPLVNKLGFFWGGGCS